MRSTGEELLSPDKDLILERFDALVDVISRPTLEIIHPDLDD